MATTNNPPSVAALDAEKARADARRALAEAKLEQLRAELALAEAEANPSAARKASVEAETALQALRKAQAEARTAAINADVAAGKAKLGSVAGSSLTGEVTAPQGTGGVEASLLAARAIHHAVAKIADRLPKLEAGRRYILFAGPQRPDLADWHLFQLQRAKVLHAYERAAALKRGAEDAGPAAGGPAPQPQQEPRPSLESLAVAATAAGAALDIASKLGSYFQSDYAVGSGTLAGVDADLVAVSLAGLLPSACWYPARWPPGVSEDLLTALTGESLLRHDTAKAERAAVEAGRKAAAEAATGEGDAARKARFEASAARFGAAAEAYDAADKAFQELLDGLAAPDPNGAPRIARVAEQMAVSAGLAQGDVAVLVQVGGGAGTTYTKKNLWTFFGSMPFFVSGGAIVSFLAVDGKNGEVKAGGQVPLHSGFFKIRDAVPWINRADA